MKTLYEFLEEDHEGSRHSWPGGEVAVSRGVLQRFARRLSDYLAEAGVGPSPPDPEPEVRYMEIPAELIDRRWFPMSSAPKDGTVIDAVGRNADATAGFPRYVYWVGNGWFEPSKRADWTATPLVCWAWRPRTSWPDEDWQRALDATNEAIKDGAPHWSFAARRTTVPEDILEQMSRPIAREVFGSCEEQHERVDALIDALGGPSPPKTPEPEVTEEMMEAGGKILDRRFGGSMSFNRRARDAYRAMRKLEPKRPVEISEAMVSRAAKAFKDGPPNWLESMRAALQAALNGER